MFRKLKLLLLAAFVAAPLGAQEIPPNYAEEEYQGVVRKVSIEDSKLVVSGWIFDVPADAPVTIRGTHGALSMLQEGMQVSVIYRMAEKTRVVLSIDQLPDNHEIPEF